MTQTSLGHDTVTAPGHRPQSGVSCFCYDTIFAAFLFQDTLLLSSPNANSLPPLRTVAQDSDCAFFTCSGHLLEARVLRALVTP